MPSRIIFRAPPFPGERRQWLFRRSCGYTLVEVVSVIAILIMLIAMTGAVFRGGRNVSKTAWDMAGFIEQARAYAVSQNTYVWIMFNQSYVSTEAQKNVAVFAVASKNGSTTATKVNLVPFGKMMVFEDVSLADLSGSTYGDRPVNGVAQLSGRTPVNTGSFVDKPLNNYTPNLVLRFSPEGSVETPSGMGMTQMQMFKWIELGLQPMRGHQKGAEGGTAILQVTGLTGQTRVYRP